MSNSRDVMLLRPNRKREMNSESENEHNKDRRSDLPDCVLLHILSLVKVKYAVRTCILSTRWKDLWKPLPSLILHSSDFSTLNNFTNFVSRLLTLRDGSTALNSLDFNGYSLIEPHLLKRIVKYVVSHNVQRLGLLVNCGIEHVPPCIFSCETLTSLKLNVRSKALFPESLNLPALTTLHLVNFAFCANGNDRAEPFSSFKRLNSLIIVRFSLSDADILCISNTSLCNLTVNKHSMDGYTIDLSSPSLRTFAFMGGDLMTLAGRNLSSIEHVNLKIWSNKYSLILLSWLLDLANIKSLTVYSSTLEVLSSTPDLLELKYPILGSLKSLKVILRDYKFWEASGMLEDPFSRVPDGIVDFLLQNSPSAKVEFTRCSCYIRFSGQQKKDHAFCIREYGAREFGPISSFSLVAYSGKYCFGVSVLHKNVTRRTQSQAHSPVLANLPHGSSEFSLKRIHLLHEDASIVL